MKRLLVVLVAAVALVAPVAAQAHPLGNFTINRFARVQVSGRQLYVRYVLDLAEIPTFQAQQTGVNANAYARAIARNLHVTVAGRPVVLTPVAHALAFPQGVGGLHTMRLELILRGPTVSSTESLRVSDTNYPDRIGWKEIVVGTNTHSISDELRAYPKSLLQSPLAITSATATVAPTHDGVPQLTRGSALEAPDRVADSGFTHLISSGHLSALVILASLAAALFWGAAHALSPGHGKTIVTAYLIGRRGTPRDAAILGAIVTVTHTIGVFALGLVTLALSQWIVPDRLYPWINLIAGASVVLIGLAVLRSRFNDWAHERAHRHGDDHHHHGHDHSHAPEPGSGMKGLVAVGISGGALPCPSALVVLLAAISLHRLAFGLVLIVAFSLGLALSITGIGLAAVLAKKAFARRSFDGLFIRALPAVSALVILVAGLAMTVKALPKVH
ncbi:MAG TPA: sulfite exporter TauE/SafE family protein [Gaiellaceae bacterium]|nr:sulfite exporter TauE/SafE family protein [Gaiellaceae bacterium]